MKYISLKDNQYRFLKDELDAYYEICYGDEAKDNKEKAFWAERIHGLISFILLEDDGK